MKNFSVHKINKILAIVLLLMARSVEVLNSPQYGQQYDTYRTVQYTFGTSGGTAQIEPNFRYGSLGIVNAPQIQRNYETYYGSSPQTQLQFSQPQPQYQQAPQTQTRQAPPMSNCDSFWSVQSNPQEGQFGVISIPSPDRVNSVIRIILSLASRLPSEYVGTIELAKDKDSSVSDIEQGRPLLYRVLFPIQNPIPRVTHIYYNDQLLCSGSPDVGSYLMTITLHHTLTTGLSTQPNPYRPTVRPIITAPNWINLEPEVKPETQWASQTTTRRPTTTFRPRPVIFGTSESTNFINDFECGVPSWTQPKTTALIVNGRNADRGQFPWLAAYFHNPPRGDGGFICGGSLISARCVLTAAHCIQKKNDRTINKAEEAHFYLGKHRLDSLNEKGMFMSGVSQFVIHDHWRVDSDSYDADIALAILVKTVTFTNFVKPICLWTSTKTYNDLVGKTGTVAGWGVTEHKTEPSEIPKWIQIPVVNEGTCLRSNNAFNELTSTRTFCAGDIEKAAGPCNGDSGGGLIIQSENKWFLRGIVSASLYNQAEAMCDTKNYSVFTDVAQFNPWIQENIQSFG